MKTKAFFNWSSGKDAAMALNAAQKTSGNPVSLLLTTINAKYQRVSMHGLHRNLLEAQAKSIDLPLEVIEIPEDVTMQTYGEIMRKRLSSLRNQGYNTSYFGDIFLDDLKAYRENMLHPLGFTTIFPLWKKDTRKLLTEFINSNFKAVVVCVNAQVLDKSFCGRIIDQSFLDDLPQHVDPCGENGEFHTFCYDGPIFKYPVSFVKGDLVYKTYPSPNTKQKGHTSEYGFWFCNLLLKK